MKTKTLLWLLALTLVPMLTKSQTVPIVFPMPGGGEGTDAVCYFGGTGQPEDRCAQINQAYASLQTSGGNVFVVTDLSGITKTTSIVAIALL